MTATAPLTLDFVLEAARKLPIDDQYSLYNHLEDELHGVNSDTSTVHAKAWEMELDRRVAEVESGVAELIPAEQVLSELRGLLRKQS